MADYKPKKPVTLRDVIDGVKGWWHGLVRNFLPAIRNVEWADIPVGTYVRWSLAFLVSLNTVLTFFGVNPIRYSETAIYDTVSLVLNVVVLMRNTYKNNSSSTEAVYADQIMTILKSIENTDAKNSAMENINAVLEAVNDSVVVPEEEPVVEE